MATTTIDPEELLRGALEKIVFFECRVSQLESELAAARQIAERARADAAVARRREVELERLVADEKGARAEAVTRADELAERVRLLEAERERLLDGLVDRARVGGAPASDGGVAEEGGADLAGFIAELRAEIEELRAFKASVQAGGFRGASPGPDARPARGGPAEPVLRIAERFEATGRVGLTARDADAMKSVLPTRSDRVLYERAMDELGSPDPGRRVRAARTLEALGSSAAAPLLAAALGRETDADVKVAFLGALARFQEPFAGDLARRELADARPPVRVAALEALAAVSGEAALPALAGAAADASPLVRRRAAILLGFARGAAADEALAAALGDADAGVARAAAAALSGRPNPAAQHALARALEHADAGVRRAAAKALGRFSDGPVDVDAPAHERRRVARRIAERLAALSDAELRAAVIAGGVAVTPTVRVEAAAPSRTRDQPRPQAPTRTSPSTFASTSTSSPATQTARAATRVAVLDPAPAPTDLDPQVLAELRAALRGCAAADLVRLLGAPEDRVAASLSALAARGAVALRGTRWFMA